MYQIIAKPSYVIDVELHKGGFTQQDLDVAQSDCYAQVTYAQKGSNFIVSSVSTGDLISFMYELYDTDYKYTLDVMRKANTHNKSIILNFTQPFSKVDPLDLQEFCVDNQVQCKITQKGSKVQIQLDGKNIDKLIDCLMFWYSEKEHMTLDALSMATIK